MPAYELCDSSWAGVVAVGICMGPVPLSAMPMDVPLPPSILFGDNASAKASKSPAACACEEPVVADGVATTGAGAAGAVTAGDRVGVGADVGTGAAGAAGVGDGAAC